MLHQVKKGVWEHLLNLFHNLMKAIFEPKTTTKSLRELDLQFTFVPPFPGLKKFPKGITQLPCITSAEYFQIMNVSFSLHRLADHLWFKMVLWVSCSRTQTDYKLLVLSKIVNMMVADTYGKFYHLVVSENLSLFATGICGMWARFFFHKQCNPMDGCIP